MLTEFISQQQLTTSPLSHFCSHKTNISFSTWGLQPATARMAHLLYGTAPAVCLNSPSFILTYANFFFPWHRDRNRFRLSLHALKILTNLPLPRHRMLLPSEQSRPLPSPTGSEISGLCKKLIPSRAPLWFFPHQNLPNLL